MNIRNDVDGLKSILGVQSQKPATPAASRTSQGETGAAALTADQATVSSAGTSVSQAASASDVRLDKVAAVKSAIDAGTYHVPASAVAGKVVDSLLSNSAASSN